MKYIYIADIDKLLPLPALEKPIYGRAHYKDAFDRQLNYEKDLQAYNNWLSKGITPSDELRKRLSDGGEYEIGKHFDVFTSEFYFGNYMNKCSICKKHFKGTDKLWFICQDCCKGVALPIEQKPLSEEGRWNKLREKFFEECTQEHGDYVEFSFRYDTDPNKVFEWFKNNIGEEATGKEKK